jgi:hypothetical protein
MTANRTHGNSVRHDSGPSSRYSSDRRTSARRVLSCRVALTLPNNEVLYGFSADVSQNGIGVKVPRRIDDGLECTLVMSFFAGGKSYKISACGQILSCVCIGMEGFRASVRFTHLEDGAAEILEEILSG